ncbi:hypothetical protein [Candidatus Amarolinea dominans]|uniref:hypothetical protein n=1 Tax=Candidatus Amarolinea dominans TaxID=3140696 RepID=UPI001DAED00E|nr:hypothetical protein [Anaerolineae bacterium]
MVTQADLDTVSGLVVSLVGKRVWNVRLGIGNFVTMEFGQQLTPDRFGQSYGEWYLWLCGCEWRIDQIDQVLIAGEDSRERLKAAVQILEGRTLLAVSLYSPAIDATFEFEGGLFLRLFAVDTVEIESWKLFTPEDKVLVVGPGSKWYYARSDIPRDET